MVNALFPPSWPLHLPRFCLLCDASGNTDLCPACRSDLPWNVLACPRCALPLAHDGCCAACTSAPPLQKQTLAPLRYAFPVDHLIAGLKYHRRLEYAPLLGRILLEAVREQPAPDIVLPVPLHPKRLAERGYNQALEIARPLSRHFRRPLETRLLRRERATAAQMTLDASARLRNPQGAFALDQARLAKLGTGLRIALVDDVMTTGATLNELSRLLLANGAATVDYWVVARTP